MPANDIIIVTGLPRSVTSMVMSMLKTGGLEVMTDDQRTADEDNPRGYFEFERVKKIEKDKEWVGDAQDKGVKVISPLLKDLQAFYTYKVIFILRKMEEVLASQNKMLVRRGEHKTLSDGETVRLWEYHLWGIRTWLQQQQNFDVLYLNYHDVARDPLDCCRTINKFLGNQLNEARMASVVDPSLYRQRAQKL